MPEYKRLLNPEGIRKLRVNLKAFQELHHMLREAVKKAAKDQGLNDAQVSRLTNLRSTTVVRDFYEGRRMIRSGKVLQATLEFSGIEKEWAAEFEALQEHLSDKHVRFISHGLAGIEFTCDVMDVFYRLAGCISSEEFASFFGEASEAIDQIINVRAEGLKVIFANESWLALCKEVLSDEDKLVPLIAAVEKANDVAFALKYKELQALRAPYPELTGTMAKAAEAVGMSKTTFTNACSASNAYRLAAIDNVINVVRSYVQKKTGRPAQKKQGLPAQKKKGRADKADKPVAVSDKKQAALEGFQATIGEKSEVLHRFTRSHLGTLEISDFLGMVSRARIESERIRLTLQQLLRCQDERVLARARTVLGEELRELHDILFVFSSNAGLEELMDVVEQERTMRDILSL